MNNRERMLKGLVYDPNDGDIMNEQAIYLRKLKEFNETIPGDMDTRNKLLKEMFAEIGKDCYIEPPLYANWGGKHVHFGNCVYANFSLTLVDDADIYIDDKVMIGPNVTIATANHPIKPSLRENGYQYNKPVHICRNVWIGANVVIVPGVTIGENSVIGAGSIVTKDIPANVVAFGNPCRVNRPIGERDNIYFYKDEKIDL